MKKYISTTLSVLLLSTTLFAQDISELENVKSLIKEDFTNSESSFPILTTVDNYFIIDNGDYLLSRNNTESEYAILASTKENISDFTLKSAIKLGPSSNKISSAGILIKAQVSASGALVFEINRKGEFRIKELLINSTYKYLSGKTSNDGWVKNREIKEEGEFNAIEIRCKENVYDIYVNNKFITTFFSPSLASGKMGILIGKDAKARIAYYYLDVPTDTENNLVTNHMNDFNLGNLANKVKQLESEKVTLTNTNERLEKEVNALKNDNTLKISNDKLVQANNSLDSLNSIISGLTSDLEATTNLLTEDRKNLQSSNSELEKGNKMISEFSVKQKEFTSKISILESDISDLNFKILNLNTDLSSKQNRLNNQIELNKELQNTNVKLNNKSDNSESKNKILQSELTSLKTKISEANNNLSNKEIKVKTLNEKVQEFSENLKKYENKTATLQSKISKLNKEILTLNTEVKSLNSKLTKEKSNSTTVTKDLRKKISEKTKQVNSLNSEVSHLKKKYSSQDILESNNIELKEILVEKENNINSFVSKITELEKSVKELEEKNNTLSKSENSKSEEISLLTTTVEDLYTKVENMKEVLIYKGFDEKGIKSESVTTTKVENKKNTTTTIKKSKKKNQKTDDNITYSVQIATYGAKVTLNQFRGLNDIFYMDSENGTYLYMSGKFENSNSAIEHRNKLVKMGYKNAFVVKLNNK